MSASVRRSVIPGWSLRVGPYELCNCVFPTLDEPVVLFVGTGIVLQRRVLTVVQCYLFCLSTPFSMTLITVLLKSIYQNFISLPREREHPVAVATDKPVIHGTVGK